MLLNLRGVPRKHAESAIRLQLNQLGLFTKIGFSYLITGEQAKVWYWDDEQARLHFPVGKILPYPEPLWHPAIETGARQVLCSEGYELEGANQQGIYRSRWFPQRPNEEEIQAFCRDIGLAVSAMPENPKPQPRLATPLHGWKISSSLGGQLSAKAWLIGLAILLIGSIATVELVQIIKLNQAAQALKTEAKTLKNRTAAIAALESKLKELQPTAQLLASQIQTPRQTTLLASLLNSGVIGPDADVYLTEWIYRSNGITATLRLGTKAKGANVLNALEKTGSFTEIRLLPDPPAGALRVELKLATQPEPNAQNASAP